MNEWEVSLDWSEAEEGGTEVVVRAVVVGSVVMGLAVECVSTFGGVEEEAPGDWSEGMPAAREE